MISVLLFTERHVYNFGMVGNLKRSRVGLRFEKTEDTGSTINATIFHCDRGNITHSVTHVAFIVHNRNAPSGRFPGKSLDKADPETGWYCYGYRSYNPVLGRWS